MKRRRIQRRRGPVLRETSIPDPERGSTSRTGDAIEHVFQLGVFESKFFQEVMDRRSRETTETNFPGEVKNLPISLGEELSFEIHVSFHFGHSGNASYRFFFGRLDTSLDKRNRDAWNMRANLLSVGSSYAAFQISKNAFKDVVMTPSVSPLV